MQITFGEVECKHQYTTTAPTRDCFKALECTSTADITQLTFKYTSQDKDEGGRVLIVENTDMFEMKLPNVPDPKTYSGLEWYINYDLDTAMPKGKTLYNQEVWVDDEFSINVSPSYLSNSELAYFSFDEDGNLIAFAILDLDCDSTTYNIGDMLGNSMITSFRSMTYGVVTSTVFIDSYKYTVENNCPSSADPPLSAGVYSLDRTFCTSSCGEDKWECPTAEGYNPFSCVVDGKTQLGCSGSTTIPPFESPDAGTTEFSDSIDGKGPIDLLETKFRLNVNAMIKYPEYWTVKSTPDGGVTSSPAIDLCL